MEREKKTPRIIIYTMSLNEKKKWQERDEGAQYCSADRENPIQHLEKVSSNEGLGMKLVHAKI